MSDRKVPFGAYIRQQRMAKEIGLREMAKRLGVSPTYLSKVERDEYPPLIEDRAKKIAQILELDPDEVLAMADRLSSDVLNIIKKNPTELTALLRTSDGLSAADLAQTRRDMEARRKAK